MKKFKKTGVLISLILIMVLAFTTTFAAANPSDFIVLANSLAPTANAPTDNDDNPEKADLQLQEQYEVGLRVDHGQPVLVEYDLVSLDEYDYIEITFDNTNTIILNSAGSTYGYNSADRNASVEFYVDVNSIIANDLSIENVNMGEIIIFMSVYVDSEAVQVRELKLYIFITPYGDFIAPYEIKNSKWLYYEYLNDENIITPQEYYQLNNGLFRATYEGTGMQIKPMSSSLYANPTEVTVNYTKTISGSTTNVSGSVTWTDINGTIHPARSVRIEIANATDYPPITLAVTQTDNNGNFTFTGINNNAPNPIIMVWAQNQAGLGVEAFGFWNGIYYFFGNINLKNNNPGFASEIGTNTADAFYVHQAIIVGHAYASAMGYSGKPNVSFPRSSTQYNNATDTIHITDERYCSFDSVLHEYGHFIMDKLNFTGYSGGNIGWYEISTDELQHKDNGIKHAWKEGWATYFSMASQLHQNVAARNIPFAGDLFYDYPNLNNGTSIRVSIFDNSTGAGLGEGNLLTVARVLLNMVTNSSISVTHQSLWNICNNSKPKDLSAFMTQVYANTPNSQINAIGTILRSQNVVPTLTTAANSEIIYDNPTFSWSIDTGDVSTTYLDEFTIVFYDTSFNKINFEVKAQMASPYVLTANHSHTLTTNQLNSFKSLVPQQFYWGIASYQYASSANTGPYISELRLMNKPTFNMVQINNGTAYSVNGLLNTSLTTLNIPATYNGLPVTAIGSSAFANQTKLTQITIPSSVISIGDSAFSGCINLTSVTFQALSNITTIANSAFNGCTNLVTFNGLAYNPEVQLGTAYPSSGGVWYKFVASYDNEYLFQKTGSSGSMKIFSSLVYDPNNATPLYNVIGEGSAQVPCQIGETVYIYVSGSGSSIFQVGLIAEEITEGTTPRDDFTAKWYKFTANANGIYSFRIDNPIGYYDRFGTYWKFQSSALFEVWDEIGGTYFGGCEFHATQNNPVVLHLNAGDYVYVFTDVYLDGDEYNYEYSIGITYEATPSIILEQSVTGYTYKYAWYAFTIPVSGNYSITDYTYNTNYSTCEITIYKSYNGKLTVLGTKSPNEEELNISINAGETIFLRITGSWDFDIAYINPNVSSLTVGANPPLYFLGGNGATLPFTAPANGYYTFNISATSAGTGKISNAYGDLFSYNQTSLTNTFRVYLSLGETVDFTYLMTNGGFITVMVEQQLYTLTPNPVTFGTTNTIDGSYLGGKWFTFTPTVTQMYFIDIEGYGNDNSLSLTIRKDYLNGSLVSFPFARTPNVYGGATLIAGTTYYIYMDTAGYTQSGTPSWTIKTVTDIDCGNITLNTFYGGVQQYGINNKYYFTPSVSGIYTIFRSGSNYNISVRDASENTVSISSNQVTLTAGTSYTITFAGNVLGQSGSVSWSLMPPYTTLSLTTQYDIDYIGGKWFVFTPATTQHYFIDIYGYGFTPIVYTGNPASNNILSFPFVRYDNGYCATLTAGTTYYIYMDTTGYTPSSGTPYWTINETANVDCGSLTPGTSNSDTTQYGINNNYTFTCSETGIYVISSSGGNYNIYIRDQSGNALESGSVFYAGTSYVITITGNSGYTGSVSWELSFGGVTQNIWYGYDSQRGAANDYKFSPAESGTYYLMITNDPWNNRAVPSIPGATLKFLGYSTNSTALYSVYLQAGTNYVISFGNMKANSNFLITWENNNSVINSGNWGIKTYITTASYTLYYIDGLSGGQLLTLSTYNIYADIYLNGQYAGCFSSSNNYTTDVYIGDSDFLCIMVYASFDNFLTISGYSTSDYTYYRGTVSHNTSQSFIPTGGGYFDRYYFSPQASGTYYITVKSPQQPEIWIYDENGSLVPVAHMGNSTDGTKIYTVNLAEYTTYSINFEGAYFFTEAVTFMFTNSLPVYDFSGYSHYEVWDYGNGGNPYYGVLTYTASASGMHTFNVIAYCDMYWYNGTNAYYLGYFATANNYTTSVFLNVGDTVNIIAFFPLYQTTCIPIYVYT